MCMSLAQEPEGQSTTEKLFRELLQVKEMQLREKEEASKALLREKEEASKQKDLRIAEQNNLIVELRGRTEAVIANRYIVETTATLHERSAGRMSSSSLQGSKNFTYTHLLDNKKPTLLSGAAKKLYNMLAPKIKERIDERSVCSELSDIFHEVSKGIHHPEWLQANASRGIYVGSDSGPLGAALGIWVAKAQELGHISYPVVLVHSQAIVARVVGGKILDPDV